MSLFLPEAITLASTFTVHLLCSHVMVTGIHKTSEVCHLVHHTATEKKTPSAIQALAQRNSEKGVEGGLVVWVLIPGKSNSVGSDLLGLYCFQVGNNSYFQLLSLLFVCFLFMKPLSTFASKYSSKSDQRKMPRIPVSNAIAM